MRCRTILPCIWPGWRNGRRDGLKIRCPKGRVGSNPTPGTRRAQQAALAVVSPQSERDLNRLVTAGRASHQELRTESRRAEPVVLFLSSRTTPASGNEKQEPAWHRRECRHSDGQSLPPRHRGRYPLQPRSLRFHRNLPHPEGGHFSSHRASTARVLPVSAPSRPPKISTASSLSLVDRPWSWLSERGTSMRL